ncbi:hypothetical protein OROGR_030450 [Orobanche gracilis]
MATADEIEYESDPEEAKLPLKLRRREASDDESGEGGEITEKPRRRIEIDESDGDSEGVASEYEDEYEEEDGEAYELDEYAEDIVEDEGEESGGGRGRNVVIVKALAVGRADAGKDEGLTEEETRMNSDACGIDGESVDVEDVQHEGEKKEIEPYAVPTAGAFYMHDDRFRENARGRNRRMFGGRKLWESNDDRKWGHDKFEELTVYERSYREGRRGSRGRNRGSGRNRAAGRGYEQGNMLPVPTSNGTKNNNIQNSAPKGFRGRGPQRYQPSFKNKAPLTHNKQSGKSNENPSYASSGRTSEYMSNTGPDGVLPRKQAFASNLNIASPPFYPSSSSTKDSNAPDKSDFRSGSIKDGNFATSQSSGVLWGKDTVDSIGVDRLYIGDSLPDPSLINSTQQQLRGQGRGMASLTQMAYRPIVSNNQVSRTSPPNQLQTVQRNPGQSRAQYFVQTSHQQFRQGVSSGLQASSPPKSAGTVNAIESGELEALSEPNKSNTALVSKGKGEVQGNGRGSLLYGGTQVFGTSGNMGSIHGDPNFPTFLPVMQFSGQHPGGIGVPAVGMAFPGYVGQPQLGRGDSEMTWLPVLTGAAGALGARYGSPYIPADGSYQARPYGHVSSVKAASSKENNTTNVGNDWKPAQRPELANDDLGQRRKNPRRYTEMKFDQ